MRERVGVTEISNYAKYRVTGPGAEAWLSSLLTARMPQPGRIVLTAMLNEAGRIVGEFTVARPTGGDEYFLFGSLAAEVHHARWFAAHLPADGSVTFEVLGLSLVGLSIAGPHARDVLAELTDEDLSTAAFRFMDFRRIEVGIVPALVGRINYSGELGYELWVAPEYQEALFDRIMAAGEEHGIRLFGFRALMSLRLEKSYGTWYREYRPIYTLHEAGLQRYVKLDHEFIGRAAYEKEAETGPERRLVALVVEPDPDAAGRRDRRRADLARRRGRRLGHLGRLRPPRRGSRSRWGTCRRRLATPDGPAAAGSRSRSSAGAGRPGSSPSRCSTPRASGCASDARSRRRPPASAAAGGGRIVVDGRPVAFEAGDTVAIAILRGGRGPRPRRDAVPGRRLRQLPRRGRRHRLRPDVPDGGPARDCGSPGIRPRAMPPLPVVAATDLTATPLPVADRAPPSRGGRRGHRRRVERAGRGRRGGTGRASRSASSMPTPARRSSRSTPDRCSWSGRPTGCSTSIRTRSSSRRAPPRSTRSAPATGWPGSSRRGPRSGCGPPAWTSGRVVAVRATRPRPVRGRRRPRVRAVVTADPRPASRPRRRPTRSPSVSAWRRAISSRGWPVPCR